MIIREEITKRPTPLYAYNAEFERAFLQAKLGIALKIIDVLKPWKNKAESKALKYPKLDEIAPIPSRYFGEREISGREITNLWRAYLTKEDKRCLSTIVRHNMRDLRQTLSLLAYI